MADPSTRLLEEICKLFREATPDDIGAAHAAVIAGRTAHDSPRVHALIALMLWMMEIHPRYKGLVRSLAPPEAS